MHGLRRMIGARLTRPLTQAARLFMSSPTMTLTQDDIALIERIVRRSVDEAILQRRQKTISEFTSAREIRSFIKDNIDALYEEFGVEQPFDAAVLRHWLAKNMQTKPKDFEVLSSGNVRWEAQVSNAMGPAGWPNDTCPFGGTARRGFYVMRRVDFAQHLLSI
jgi:hypothetical protein